jgi:peroxiredoxin
MKMKAFYALFLGLFLVFQPSLAAMRLNDVQGFDLVSAHQKKVLNGKLGTVVIFVSAVCPCSNSHVAELSALQKEYSDFSFVGVHSNSDESAETSAAYFKKLDLGFPIVQDTDQKIADAFKALKTPHAFVLNTKGEIIYKGGVSNSADFTRADEKFLRNALNDVQLGKAVGKPEGRTLGCLIARGKNAK